MSHKIQAPKEMVIPYYDEDHDGGFFASARSSAKRRNMSLFRFLVRKLFNTFLYWISYFCPVMSVRVLCHKLRGVRIGKNVTIHIHCMLDNAYPEYIVLEDDVSIAQHTTILAHSNPRKRWKGVLQSMVKPVILKKGCFIGLNSTLLPGVTIGRYSIVSAGSVVTGDVPEYSIVTGNPAKITACVKRFLDPSLVE